MGKRFFYDSIDDSMRRIGQSVVMARSSPKEDYAPAYLIQVSGLNTDQIGAVQYLPLTGQNKVEQVPLTGEYFEVRRLPSLGYVDYGDSSFYLTRKPVRNGKQGLCRNNVNIPQSQGNRQPTFEVLLQRRDFSNLLLDKYQSFKSVFEHVLNSEEPLMRSFSKTMALSIDDMESVSLWNRGIRVGVCNSPKRYGPVFKLPQKFKYLTEELNESGIKVEG